MAQPSLIFGFSLRHVAYTSFKVFAVGVYGADHHLVPQHKIKVDAIGWHFDFAVAASNAGKHKHAVLSQPLHAFENNGRRPGGFEDQIERPELLCAILD